MKQKIKWENKNNLKTGFQLKMKFLKMKLADLIKKAAIWSFHNNLRQLSTDMQSAAFL